MTITRSGISPAAVWTPAGFRIVCPDHPETERLMVCDVHGTKLYSATVTGVGALNGFVADVAPDGTIGWAAQSNADRLVTGQISPAGAFTHAHTDWPAFGTASVGVRWNGEGFIFYAVLNPTHYQRIIGSRRDILPIGFETTQGWVDTVDGLRWADVQRDNLALQLRYDVRAAGVSIGQDLATRADRLAGVNRAGERFLVFDGLGMEPRIAANPEGTQWVATWRQLKSLIGIATFPPFPALPAEPAIQYGPFPKNPNRCAVAIDAEPGGLLLGSAEWPDLCRDGVLHDCAKPQQLARHAELARQNNSPVWLYQDTRTPDWTLYRETAAKLPKDVAWLPAFQAYPAKGEPFEDHSASTELQMSWAHVEFKKFAVFAAGFTGVGQAGARTLDQVRHGLRAVARSAARYSHCRIVVVFSFDRSSHLGPDGVSKLPEVAADVSAWRASVADADDYPTVAELKPALPVTPPVTPKPPVTEPVVSKPHATKSTRQIAPGEILYHDTYIESANRRWRFYNQTDGQGVILRMHPDGSSTAAWSTGTTDKPGLTFVMQYEGNLVAYQNGKDVWATPVTKPNAFVRLSDLGLLELVAPSGEVVWTHTNEAPAGPVVEPSQPHVEPARTVRTGVVRLEGVCFADDGGPYFAIGQTFFAAAWAYRHDRDRLVKNLEFLRDHGVDYVRVLGAVGPDRGGWEDRTVDPTDAGWEEDITGTTDLVYEHGMRTQWTLFGGIDRTPDRASRERVVRAFIAMSKGREHKIQLAEIANEGFQNFVLGLQGREEMRAFARMIRDETPLIVALSAPAPFWFPADGDGVHSVEFDLDKANRGEIVYSDARWLYEGSAANLFTEHGDRSEDGTGGLWRWIRQGWDVQFYEGKPKAWTNNEPKGPKSSVKSDADPLRITMAAALTPVFGGAGFVYHTGPGVRFGGAADVNFKGREPNFWEVEHCEQTYAGFKAIRSVLPPDLANWKRANISTDKFPNAPFEFAPLLDAQEHGRVLRAFSATSGNSFYSLPIQISGHVECVARHPMNVEVIQPMTAEVLRTVDLAAGQALTLDASEPALILRGTWR